MTSVAWQHGQVTSSSDFKRMQIRTLTLTAKRPDGSPLELKKQFQLGGLAGSLGGKQ